MGAIDVKSTLQRFFKSLYKKAGLRLRLDARV